MATARLESRWGKSYLSTRSKLWIGAAAGLTVAQAFVSTWLPRGYALTAVSDILCAMAMFAPMLAFVGNAIHSQGRVRFLDPSGGCLVSLAGGSELVDRLA